LSPGLFEPLPIENSSYQVVTEIEYKIYFILSPIMAVVVSQFGPLRSSLFASVHDTTDPQPKYRLSFIVDGLIISNEIHETNIKKYGI
jgi:hypothetical protein